MGKQHQVAQGETLARIADQEGFFLRTLWDDPANAALKEERGDPNVLAPGDVVEIKDLEEKEEQRGCQARHVFKRRGVPSYFRMRLLRGAHPRAAEQWSATIDGKLLTGKTDSEGLVEFWVPPNAKQGELTFRPENKPEQTYKIRFGNLDPIDLVSGVKGRLNALGFACGAVDDVLDDKTKTAIKRFQGFAKLPDPSGELDQATRDALVELHDEQE